MRKHRDEARDANRVEGRLNNMLLVGGILLMGLFFLVYRFGSSQEEKSVLGTVGALQKRNKEVVAQLAACRSLITDEDILRATGEKKNLLMQLKNLEDEFHSVTASQERVHTDMDNCTTRLQTAQDSDANTDDEENARTNELLAEIKTLSDKITAMKSQGGGMPTVVLLALLRKMLKYHDDLLQRAGKPPVSDPKQYIADLVTKWKTRRADAGKGALGSNFTIGNMGRGPNATVLLNFDPDHDAKDVFIPTYNPETKEWQRPSWQGRVGTQEELRRGMHENHCPVTDINHRIRVLYEYALCAVGNNITNFMYPTCFRRCADCPPKNLDHFIDTPLVLFCQDCRPHHLTKPFKQLCQDTAAEKQYGSRFFWRVRSRLRFRSQFYSDAEAFLETNNLMNGTKLIAVRIPSDAWRQSCTEMREGRSLVETLCYKKLLVPRKVVEHSTDPDEQCAPPLTHIIDKINRKAREYLAEKIKVKVYLSGNITDADYLRLKKDLVTVVLRPPSVQKPVTDDIVDTIIASRATDLFLNRFELKSTQIAETYMLAHNLKATGISVW